MSWEIAAAAAVNAAAARAVIKAMGMMAANQAQASRGQGPEFLQKDFDDLIDTEGLNYNTVTTTLRGC
jgi:hypothetical protein